MKPNTTALVVGLLCAALSGCTGTEDAAGQFKIALETGTPAGTVYRLRQARFAIDRQTAGDGLERVVRLNSDDRPFDPVLVQDLAPGDYRVTLSPGWVLERQRVAEPPEIVQAELVGEPVQFFEITPRASTFVLFTFAVDGAQVVIGDPGSVVIGIGVIEPDGGVPTDGGDGGPQPDGPPRELIETNLEALGAFNLREVLTRIATNSGREPDPERLYRELIDSYASAPNATLPDAAHCGDETTDGAPSLNGFPLRCDRLETQQVENLDRWFPTAVVNRIDLAPEDGSHCGQQRIIFANNAPIGNQRMFMILEAQIPNPSPECGVAACQPLAQFWEAVATIADGRTRGDFLRAAFLDTESPLTGAGFGPFVRAEAYSVGTGQIRTNNFNDFPWTLREFKVLSDPDTGALTVRPFPVAESPHGALWNDTAPLPQGEACRQSFLQAMEGLLVDDPARMTFIVDEACKDAESQNDFFSEQYPLHLASGSGGFAAQIEMRLAGTGLTPEDIAARAQFAGSCIGCHEEANGISLGRGVIAPRSRGFVHVDEFFPEDCGDGTQCFGISDALRRTFLPSRRATMQALLSRPGCGMPPPPDVDGGPSEVDAGVDAGPLEVDAGVDAGPRDAGPGSVDAGPPARDAGRPVPGIITTPELPSADTPIEVLVEQDANARPSGRTIGGRSAASTH